MFAHRFLIAYLISVLIIVVAPAPLIATFTQYNHADPYPIYSTYDPYLFLSLCERNHIKCYDEDCCQNSIRLAFSPYRQGATLSQNLHKQTVNLGNLKGNWNMLGLFYEEQTQADLINLLGLDTAPSYSVCNINSDDETSFNFITSPQLSDPSKQFGFFDVQGKYRKYGLRMEAEVRLFHGASLLFQTGVAHIHVEPTFVDLSCSALGQSCLVHDCDPSTTTQTCPPVSQTVTPSTTPTDPCANASCCIDYASCSCKTLVIDRIMKERKSIASYLRQNIEPYDKTSMEDLQMSLNFFPMFPINQDTDAWPFFIFTPFASIGVTFPISKAVPANFLFAVPFSNNGHWAYGGKAGFTIDFVDTIAIGSAVQFVGFGPKTHTDFPIPTNQLQVGIFPELATVRIRPGLNWDFALYMSAYHFIYNLSAYVQYVFVNHDKDNFNVIAITHGGDTPQLCDKLHDESEWQFQAINTALNYDISQNFMLGLGFQIPVAGRAVFRSTTIIGTLQVMY